MKKNAILAAFFGVLAAASAWALDIDGVGHFHGHPAGPIHVPIHGPGFHPGHPSIVYHPGYCGPQFVGWHQGYVRRFGFPLWYTSHISARYAFNWGRLKQVTCTAQAPDGGIASYTQSWTFGWSEEQIQFAENQALMQCDAGSNGARGCFLAGCTPVYY